MLGLILLPIFGLFIFAYLWLLRTTYRATKRKTGSYLKAVLAVIGVLVLTCGDTFFNRWYHREILCQREDVGVKIFAKAQVPPEYWDDKNHRPILDKLMNRDRHPSQDLKPFLDRYAATEKFEKGGWFPLTAYERHVTGVVDVKTGQMLSQFVDYWPAGGMWWLYPLKFIRADSAIGWVLSRGQPNSCFQYPTNHIVEARWDTFQKQSIGDTK